MMSLKHIKKVIHLTMEIKQGSYKEALTHVNPTDMEVWRVKTFTLRNVNLDEIAGLVTQLFSSGERQQISLWEPVMELELGEY